MPDIGKDYLSLAPLKLGQNQENHLKNLSLTAQHPQNLKRNGNLKGLHGQQSASESEKGIQDASQQFEALLLQQMLQAMWQTVPQGELLSGSKEEDLYRDMLNEAVAKSTSQGRGIGIREVMAKDMRRLEGKK